MTALDICCCLVPQHRVASPAHPRHGGLGHWELIRLRCLIRDARSLLSANDIEARQLAAAEYNEGGVARSCASCGHRRRLG